MNIQSSNSPLPKVLQPSNSGIIRAKLYHLDASVSEITLTIPCYSLWGDYEETGAMFLGDYINLLASKWVQIEKFIIEVGSIDHSGRFTPSLIYKESEIPLEMIFQRGERGKWIKYKDALSKANKSVIVRH